MYDHIYLTIDETLLLVKQMPLRFIQCGRRIGCVLIAAFTGACLPAFNGSAPPNLLSILGFAESLNLATAIPSDGSAGVALNQTITLGFGSAVDESTVAVQPFSGACTGSLRVSSNGFSTCIGGSLDMSGNPMFVFRPSSSFFEETEYQVCLTPAIRDREGRSLGQERILRFRTGRFRGQEVRRVYLAAADQNRVFSAGAPFSIYVEFDGPVQVGPPPAIALANGGVAAYADGAGGSVLRFAYTPAPGEDTTLGQFLELASAAAIGPAGSVQNLAPPGGFNAVLTAPVGAGNANALTASGARVDTIAPSVVSQSPSPGATAAAAAQFLLQFNETLATSSLSMQATTGPCQSAHALQLRNGLGDCVGGTLAHSGASATLTPAAALAPGAYTLHVNDGTVGLARDLAGNPAPLYSSAAMNVVAGAAPAVLSILSSVSGPQQLNAGAAPIVVSLVFSSNVTVAGGNIRLKLNSMPAGAPGALCAAASANSIDCTYTIAAGDNNASGVLDLADAGALVLNGGSIVDTVTSIAANLSFTLPTALAAENLVIDTAPPTFAGLRHASPLSATLALLRWTDASDNRSAAAAIYYRIYHNTTSAGPFAAPGTPTAPGANTFNAGGLGGERWFVVQACDGSTPAPGNCSAVAAPPRPILWNSLERFFPLNGAATEAIAGATLGENGGPIGTGVGRFGDAGGAYNLNGATQSLDSAVLTGLPVGAASRTLCAWISPTSWPASGMAAVLGYGRVNPGDGYSFGLYGDGLRVSLNNVQLDAPGSIPDPALNPGLWRFVCAVHDSGAGDSRLYVDGVQVAVGGLSPTTSAAGGARVRVGVWPGAGANLNGRIGEAYIWSRALSLTELSAMAAN